MIKEAEEFAKLQRTSATIEQIEQSYKDDAIMILDTCESNGVKPKRILDIGCGIAGPECYMPYVEEFYLIDKSTIDSDLHYGFQKTGSFYNSLEIAKNNLVKAIKPRTTIPVIIMTQEATEDNKILFDKKFDLVISLISCGFHYPVDTYLNQVYEKLENGGIFIVDLRKGTDGLKKCKAKFKEAKKIQDQKKYERWCFKK